MRSALVILVLVVSVRAQALTFSIDAPEGGTILTLAVDDVRDLLRQAGLRRDPVDPDIRIEVIAPHRADAWIPHAQVDGHPYPVLKVPPQHYAWTQTGAPGAIHLTLAAPTEKGLANGLYGLLQEDLGFAFIHPRQTVIPDLDVWPITSPWTREARPRFEKAGFHLHTQHPIELTEYLLDPRQPGALDRVVEYIDWLARNGQNDFEFNLLESIDLDTWPAHAARFVDHAHARGILCGLDLSLHMTQQKAFMLYRNPPATFIPRRDQIRRNVERLFDAPWDIWNVEFSTTEFTEGNVRQKNALRAYLNHLLIERGCTLFGREHVVRSEAMVDGGDGPDHSVDSLDDHRGVMSHTVMFYDLTDERAPVYENTSLRHMDTLLREQMQVRETWYYPESAYWVTFDNSVPMLLLPYLEARLSDILRCDSLGVPGHLTFSSGWEWGYWMIDWSIARWSWEHTVNGAVEPVSPLSVVSEVFRPDEAAVLQAMHDLHLREIKQGELIRYLTAQTVTDELALMRLEFHPRPWFEHYGYLARHATVQELTELRDGDLERLADLRDQHDALLSSLDSPPSELFREIERALEVTGLRIAFRHAILHELVRTGLEEKDVAHGMEPIDPEPFIERAQALVDQQEAVYRYPVEMIARPFNGHTYCDFGYLDPVHDLHFWRRELAQLRNDRWGPFYKNIWNIPRTIGLID